MANNKRIFDKDANYTQAGRDIAAIVDAELDAIIKRYADDYDRVEFEYMMLSEIPFRFASHYFDKKFKDKKI